MDAESGKVAITINEDNNQQRRVSTTAFSWREYLSFLIINACQVAAIQFYQSIANTTLGSSKYAVATTLLTQYGSQIIINMTIPYWSRFLSYNARIIMCTILFIVNFILMGIAYQISTNNYADNDSLFIWPRIIAMICIILTSISSLVTEITLFQYGAFYHKSCTDATSTGSGIGAIIGALWGRIMYAFPAKMKFIPIMSCIVFPIIMCIVYFFVLPSSSALIAFENENMEKGNSTNQSKKQQNQNYGFLRVMKLIYCELMNVSLPLLLTYLFFEFMRGGLISRIWDVKRNTQHKTFYTEFVLAFRIGNLLGKASTNLIVIRQLFMFPILIGYNMILFGAFYLSSSFEYFVNGSVGHWLIYILMAVPIGLSYGSVFSNVMNGLRNTISDTNKREIALGNIKQVQVNGQIFGILSTYLLK